MAVTDWAAPRKIDGGLSGRLAHAKFVVLIDEDFLLQEANGLPIQQSPRVIERVTETIPNQSCMNVAAARSDSALPHNIISHYQHGAYLHVFIEP